MTIRHLEIFITVADCGKMNTAAKELYISQPSVSQAVAELEKYYGVKLFERLSQKLFLTESGVQLLPYARHIVDSFENMDLMMMKMGEHPKIRVGASVSVGTCLLNDVIEKAQESPKKGKESMPMDIRVVVNNTTFIENMIVSSQLDVGIVEGMVSSKELIQIPLCKDELVIVAGRKHPFYARKVVELEELQGLGVIAREDGSMVRNQYEQMLAERGIHLEQKWSCTNTEAIKNAVIVSKEFAILSKIMVEKEIKEGTLRIVPIKDTKVIREIKLIYHQNKFMSKSLQYFVEIAKEIIG